MSKNQRSTPEMKRIRRSLFKRDGEKCVHCSTTSNLTVDHILPKSKGGTWKLGNLQMLCRPCHDIKDNYKGISRRHVLKRTFSIIEKWK